MPERRLSQPERRADLYLTISNIITVVCGFITLYATYQILRITRARAALALLLAVIYITIVRLIITVAQVVDGGDWIEAHTSQLILPFWPFFALALVLLWLSLRDTLISRDRRKNLSNDQYYDGPDRRRKR